MTPAEEVLAATADACCAAAVDVIFHGQTVAQIVATVRRAAERHGVADFTAVVAGARGQGSVSKAETVIVRLGGAIGGQAFRVARTFVVGFDTLPAQVAIGNAALRALRQAIECLQPGWSERHAPSPSGPGGALTVSVSRLAAAGSPAAAAIGGAGVPLTAGEVVYVEVVAVAADGETIVLGDTLRVATHAAAPLTRFPHRLWL
jgi:hypothetical protein